MIKVHTNCRAFSTSNRFFPWKNPWILNLHNTSFYEFLVCGLNHKLMRTWGFTTIINFQHALLVHSKILLLNYSTQWSSFNSKSVEWTTKACWKFIIIVIQHVLMSLWFIALSAFSALSKRILRSWALSSWVGTPHTFSNHSALFKPILSFTEHVRKIYWALISTFWTYWVTFLPFHSFQNVLTVDYGLRFG